MSEKFRNVETFIVYDGESIAYVNERGDAAMTLEFDCTTLKVAEARALRDWLNKALPCEHKGDRYGTSIDGKEHCCECGETLP